MAPPKNDNCSHFAKHRLLRKKRFAGTPSWPQIGVFLRFSQKIDVEQKAKLKEKGIWNKN